MDKYTEHGKDEYFDDRPYICENQSEVKIFASKYWGHTSIQLTPELIEAIQKGSYVVAAINEEYTISISMKEDDDDVRKS